MAVVCGPNLTKAVPEVTSISAAHPDSPKAHYSAFLSKNRAQVTIIVQL
jgi:hypothetical protein